MRIVRVPRVLVGVGVIAALVAAFMSVGVANAEPTRSPLSAADSNKGITVSGQGEVTVKPDLAFATLGVETQYRTAQDAQKENARLLGQVISKLSALGIPRDKIETANFNLWPVRTYNKAQGTEQVVGYRVTNQIVITVVELDKVGPVVDAAVAAGANNVQSIAFSVRDTANAKAQALREATLDARNKAEAMAEALGLSLSGVIAMNDQTVSTEPPQLMKATAMFADTARSSETPIAPGDLKIRATVMVNFGIK